MSLSDYKNQKLLQNYNINNGKTIFVSVFKVQYNEKFSLHQREGEHRFQSWRTLLTMIKLAHKVEA